MVKKWLILILLTCLAALTSFAQEDPFVSIEIPAQNQLKFNRFLLNPTFSTVREDKSYINVWHRNQWIQFDDSYQTYLVSYSGRIGDRMGLGLSLYHQKFGTISNFGVMANYAYGVRFTEKNNFTFGFNLSYYNSGLDPDAVISGEVDPRLQALDGNSLLSFQPGFNLSLGSFDVGLYAENLFDYNLKTSESLTSFSEKTFSGHLMYTKKLASQEGLLQNGKLSVLARGRKVGEGDFIPSGSLILDLPKIGWLQGGYDDVFGVAGGIGFNITQRLSIGYTYEKGISDAVTNFGPTHEVSFAYSFSPTLTDNMVLNDEDAPMEEELADVDAEEKTEKSNSTQGEKINISAKDKEIVELKTRLAENDMILEEMMIRQDSINAARDMDIERRYNLLLKYVKDSQKEGKAVAVESELLTLKDDLKNLSQISEESIKGEDKTSAENTVAKNKVLANQDTHKNEQPLDNGQIKNPIAKSQGLKDIGEKGKILTETITTKNKLVRGNAEKKQVSNVTNNTKAVNTKSNEQLETTIQAKPIDLVEITPNPAVTLVSDTKAYETSNGTKEASVYELPEAKAEEKIANESKIPVGTKEGSNETNKLPMKRVVAKNDTNTNESLPNNDTSIARVPEPNAVVESIENKTSTNKASTNNKAPVPIKKPVADPIVKLAKENNIVAKTGKNLPGVKDGYYIIANVYKEDLTLNRFTTNLDKKGIDNSYFSNPHNNLKYVYLKHFDNWEEALASYKNNVDGSYPDDKWIFKVDNSNVKKNSNAIVSKSNIKYQPVSSSGSDYHSSVGKLMGKGNITTNKPIKKQKALFAEGIQSGYYIVANVFSVESNATKFIANLKNKGISAKYFKNPKNGYNYVYLQKSDSWNSAVELYQSNVNNTYTDEIWIMPINKT